MFKTYVLPHGSQAPHTLSVTCKRLLLQAEKSRKVREALEQIEYLLKVEL